MTFPHQPGEPRQRGGTLCVRLPKGLTMEFTYKTEQIRQRINGYFGYDAVARIAFEPVYGAEPARAAPLPVADPAALEEIRQTAQTIEDEDLRAAMESFGQALIGYRAEKQKS
jgi:hypothetical protein